MSIVLTDGYRQTGEVEFEGRHPDIFSTYLAASLINKLAHVTDDMEEITNFRADINVQCLGRDMLLTGVTPIEINIGGQLTMPKGIYLRRIAYDVAINQLKKAGYLKFGDFVPEKVTMHTDSITRQSTNLARTSRENRFADSSVIYGHYIADPYGVNGTFPSLIIGKKISRIVERLSKTTIPELRSDGKVHVTVRYTKKGFEVEDIFVSVAHKKNPAMDFKKRVVQGIIDSLFFPGVDKARIRVNAGGDFDVYFLQTDFGSSKSKDDVIITGGLHQLGTDKVWGKCLYKASSTLVPFAFSLSRSICEVTGAKFSSVCTYAQYGAEKALFRLENIDSVNEDKRDKIDRALSKIPSDRDSMRKILDLDVNIDSYSTFNDVFGFHSPDKPWKERNPELESLLKKNL